MLRWLVCLPGNRMDRLSPPDGCRSGRPGAGPGGDIPSAGAGGGAERGTGGRCVENIRVQVRRFVEGVVQSLPQATLKSRMKAVCICLFVFFAQGVLAQNFRMNHSGNEAGRVRLLAMGGSERRYCPDSCRASVDKKYGITFKVIPGCVITNWRRWRMNHNYRQANRTLEQRNGKGWEERYAREVQTCRGE